LSQKIQVLDYWLSCVREQDIQKTNLDNNLNHHQYLPLDDDNVLLSNQRDSVKISVSSILKDILKKERTRQLYRNNKDSRPVFFFPIVIINGQSMPLFYVDLSDIEDQIIGKDGDTSFEINPWSLDTKIGVVSDTFVKLGYDEEYIEIGDSVIGFVEKITGQFTLNFQLALKELLDYIKKESQQSTNSYTKISEIKSVGILKYSDFSEATLIFKKDLLFIKEHSSLYDNHLIDSYISKKSNGISFSEAPFVGGFFDFPVSQGQSIAISEVAQGERGIISVQGGPGTGKTTLILSVIASILTKRALGIAKGNEVDLGFILVTSFNNKAVENVVNIIEKEYGEKFSNWLYLQLGNREKREFASNRIDSFAKQIESEKFDRHLYDKLKRFLISAESSILSSSSVTEENTVSFSQIERKVLRSIGYREDYESNELISEHITKLMKVDDGNIASCLSSINYSIKNDTENLEKVSIAKVILERKITFYEDLSAKYPDASHDVVVGERKAYKRDTSEIKERHLSQKENYRATFWSTLVNFLFKKTSRTESDVDAVCAAKDKEDYTVSRLIEHKNLSPLNVYVKKYDLLRDRSARLEHKLSRKKVIRDILVKLLKSTSKHSSLEQGRLNNVSDHKSIFEASLHFMYQHILKQKADIKESVVAWQLILKGEETDNHDYHHNFKDFVCKVSLPFPVLGCTLSSLGSIFDKSESTFVNNKPFEISICDEAGIVPIFCMPSILMRSQRSLVIGDQKQLSPIISIDKNRLSEFSARHSLSDSENIYNPILSSAFQRSAFASKSNFSDIGESVILDEHRRCQKKISDCFIDIGGYTKIINQTPPLDEDDEKTYNSISESEITFIDVKGSSLGKKNTNVAEIQRIAELLDEMEQKGIDIKSQVGIITPFQGQSVLLLNEFRRRLSHSLSDKKIGTVHAFQGSEYDIVILSLVAFNKSFHVQFISQSPNLLNVAVSRAKSRIFIVGDKDYLSNQDGNLKKLLKHCQF